MARTASRGSLGTGLCSQAVDLAGYRAEAERFASAIALEHYRHYAGLKPDLELEPIYAEGAELFTREAVEWLRDSDERALAEFAVEGLIGRATRRETEQLAALEAGLELQVGGEAMPYRAALVAQANEHDPDRRADLAAAREAIVEERLDPLLLQVLERSRELTAELGWPSVKAMCSDLSGIDLDALGRVATALLDATKERFEPTVEPALRVELGFGFERLRRSDLPAFFRARSLDLSFPADRLAGALEGTVDALGIAGGAVIVDREERPTKSPRAFCAPVRVPDEVYLVIAPQGGRDDYEALLHEAGHAHHYAHVERTRPFEDRYLGDNSITEAFAFTLQRLAAEPEWLARRLGVGDPQPIAAHSRASKLVFLRRYAAKLLYELELHDARDSLDGMRERYARGLSEALHVQWPSATWLDDVDPFFYAARYLRAWALEALAARALAKRFGAAWFEQPEAGRFLSGLWAGGQGMSVAGLLAELGETPDDAGGPRFDALLAELSPASTRSC